MAQEALNNVDKHARASQAGLSLSSQQRRARLEVWDDGCGFDPISADHAGLGLGTMRERAENIGAILTINSQVGRGTRLVVDWERVPGR